MQILAPLGAVLDRSPASSASAYCIVQGLRIRRAGLPPPEIHARLHRLLAINLGVGGAGRRSGWRSWWSG